MDRLRGAFKDVLLRSERYTRVDMRYLVRGSFWLNGSDAFLALISLGLSVLVAAYVPKEAYGSYRYILSIMTIVGAFSLSGMNSAVTRAVALGREGALAKSLLPQLRYGVLQFLMAGGVGFYYLLAGNVSYALAFAVIAIAAPASGVCNTYTAYLNGKKDFKRMALWRAESGIVNTAAMVAAVLGSPTVLMLTAAYVVSNFAANTWFLWRTFRRYRPNVEYDEEDLTYGKHLSLMNGLNTLASQLDSVLVYHLLGPASLAVYSFAILIPERLKTTLSYLPALALPRLAVRTNEELRATVNHRVLLAVALTLVAAVGYAIIAPIFFGIFFPQYDASVPYTMAAGFSLVLLGAPKYLNTVFTAKSLYRPLYYLSLSTPLVKIALSVSCILLFGVWGAIAARLGANLFNGLLSYALFDRELSRPVRQ